MKKFDTVVLKTCIAYLDDKQNLVFARSLVTGLFVKHSIAHAELIMCTNSTLGFTVAMLKSVFLNIVKRFLKNVDSFIYEVLQLSIADYLIIFLTLTVFMMLYAWHSQIL